MKKEKILYSIAVVLCYVVWYLIMSAILWDLDISNWNWVARLFFLGLGFSTVLKLEK